MECATAIQSPGIVVDIISYMVHEMCWFSWTRLKHTRIFSSQVHSCIMLYLRSSLYETQSACLFSESIKNLDLKCWCIWIARPSWRGIINTFTLTYCIMACPIDARRTYFSFPTNKLFKNILRDLGRYSTFFRDDSNPSGEG